MKSKGFAIVESLVLLVLFVVVLSLVYSNLNTTNSNANKTRSISNLKNLVGIYISGQCERKPSPKSKGHTFWLAMFVGDSEEVVGALKIDDAYASPSMAGNLICPADRYCKSYDDIKNAFEDSIISEKQGWDQLPGDNRLYTSYAGPKSRRAFTRQPSAIVGCEGSRNGYGYFPDGFCTVNSSQGASFMEYKELGERYPQEWTGKETAPNWNSELLAFVSDLNAISDEPYEKLPEAEPIELNPTKEAEDKPAPEIEKNAESTPKVSENIKPSETKANENADENSNESNNNLILIIVIAVLAVLVIAIVIILLKKKK